jgi:hypothetical protein
MGAPPPYPRRPRAASFSPRYTLLLLYFALLVIVFGLLFALPDLLAAFRALPAGQGELTPEELARARDAARGALAGRVPLVVLCAFAALGLALWRGALPGLRRS